MGKEILKFILAVWILFAALFISAQSKPSQTQPKKVIVKKEVSADIVGAIPIQIGNTAKYGPTVSPNGFGKKQEIYGGKRQPYLFKQEHNSAWYQLEVSVSGTLELKIIPIKRKDDYDFVLFKCDTSIEVMAKKIASGKLKPIRANISRVDTGKLGITGLSKNGSVELVFEGIGDNFSKSVEVNKWDTYLLGVDNVYENGDGHTLQFNLTPDNTQKVVKSELDIDALTIGPNTTLNGQIKNEEGKVVKTEITVYDRFSKEVLTTNNDSISGKFQLKFKAFDVGKYYTMTFIGDSTFIGSKVLYVEGNAPKVVQLPVELPKIEVNKKYKFKNLYFVPGSDVALNESLPLYKTMLKFMNRHPKISILIEGHTNGGGHGEGSEGATLSLKRSKSLKKYLVENKVNENRASCVGYGDKYMVYPPSDNEVTNSMNRRVEVKIVGK